MLNCLRSCSQKNAIQSKIMKQFYNSLGLFCTMSITHIRYNIYTYIEIVCSLLHDENIKKAKYNNNNNSSKHNSAGRISHNHTLKLNCIWWYRSWKHTYVYVYTALATIYDSFFSLYTAVRIAIQNNSCRTWMEIQNLSVKPLVNEIGTQYFISAEQFIISFSLISITYWI